ncbi:MAG: sugar ABC transporter substrate-binding protein [Spirochaetia bacterium]|nr:sugar ABC transporter substrate-binding protein [Spirochaetia bacterium]
MRNWRKPGIVIFILLYVLCTTVFAAGQQEAETGAVPAGEVLSEFEDVYPEFAAGNADIDWRQFSGSTIHVAMLSSVLMDWQVEMIPDFERLTGIKVEVEGYAENALWQKEILDFSSGTGQFDAMFVGPFFAPRFAKEEWVADLSEFINDPTLTDKDWYDYGDILGSIREAYKVGDYVVAIPLDGVTHCLFYRKDILEKYNVPVPTTMKELEKAAKKLTLDTDGDGEIDLYGIGLRGVYNQITLPAFMFTYGGGYIDDSMKSIITSPETKAGIGAYVSLLQNYGPPGSAAKNWPDVLEDFRQGNTAMIVDTIAWANQFEDPEKSKVAGKVGVANIPGMTSEKPGEPGWWSWSLSMNNDSRVKGATWLYMQWATSKLQSLRFSLKRGVTSRNWVTGTDEYLSIAGKLNDGDWLDVYLQGMDSAHPGYLATQINGLPIPESTEITKTVGTEVTSIISGQKSLDQALKTAHDKVDSILVDAGYR